MKRDPRLRRLGERRAERRLHGVRIKREHQALQRFTRSLFAMTRAMAAAADEERAFVEHLKLHAARITADLRGQLDSQRLRLELAGPPPGPPIDGVDYLPFVEMGTTVSPEYRERYLRPAFDVVEFDSVSVDADGTVTREHLLRPGEQPE